jgi:peptide-methionine (R)-S-oxide reductase
MITRRGFLGGLLGGAAVLPLVGCGGPTEPDGPRPEVYKTRSEWQKLVSPAAFAVLFNEDTEQPGSSPLNNEHRSGTYLCAACLIPLFSSETKYESGTGWPSFWQPIEGRLAFKPDLTTGEPRTEYHCLRCGGHQGHRFDDGPPPTGLRHCNNGLALQFVPSGTTLPAPRT